ncbi:PQQ-dependent sugar dehydrogenase [Pseudomaricurvus alcaniphilus]|uniref:PQQ-dependent sugar dehydrogenase n=1 Tax=Pseudomaricurvus alcaniphilus TaxID=1166482 RepID=UPI00140C32C6|nr:PQQ-dependent sugar dehydrogenase [Pseudomaricurvus alcaniphilus]NHN36155.1 PQQ-dependent sugar dehydrogenase [Pseudomaricurvus alcaniphilus]
MAVRLTLLLCLFSSMALAGPYEMRQVITGITVPWGMVQLADGQFLVTDRAGKLYRADPATDTKIEITGLPEIEVTGQGGLLDIELHPDFVANRWVYLSYASAAGAGSGSNTAIVRARLEGQSLVDLTQLYKAPNTRGGRHFGSRIEFDSQGYLYFSIGDRGNESENPQDISRDNGKVYRLHDDGRIPDDNPFVNNKNARAAIYSYGHRNPQGMVRHPQTGAIWIHEHGPRGGDEINLIARGKNYGWPVITYGINYNGTKITDLTHKEGMEQPLYFWDPSIAPSGMTFVTSELYPEWQGHLLVGSLKFGYLVLCKLDGNKVVATETVLEGVGRVRNVKQMPDGYIYVATDGNGIYQVLP